MELNNALLFAYEALGGSIQGKTKLQKEMYFLGIMLGEDFGYGPHYYGPYSARVAAANQELKTLGYVSETKAVGPTADNSGFPIARYDFRLTPDGQAVIAEKKRRLREEWAQIESAADRLTDAGQVNYTEISIAAKSYFLLDQQGRAASADEIVVLARKFGWEVKQEEIDKAVQFLQRLNLVTVSARA